MTRQIFAPTTRTSCKCRGRRSILQTSRFDLSGNKSVQMNSHKQTNTITRQQIIGFYLFLIDLIRSDQIRLHQIRFDWIGLDQVRQILERKVCRDIDRYQKENMQRYVSICMYMCVCVAKRYIQPYVKHASANMRGSQMHPYNMLQMTLHCVTCYVALNDVALHFQYIYSPSKIICFTEIVLHYGCAAEASLFSDAADPKMKKLAVSNSPGHVQSIMPWRMTSGFLI